MRACVAVFALVLAGVVGCGASDSGTTAANAGAIGFWMNPSWDGTDPRNLSIVRFETLDPPARLQVFKNGIYLRVLLTSDGDAATALTLDMEGEHWLAGEWHLIAITWADGLLVLYGDGERRSEASYASAMPTGTAMLEARRTGTDSEAILVGFFGQDLAATAADIAALYAAGPR